MAISETARLLAELDLKDTFSGKLKGASDALSGFEGRLGKISRGAGQVAGGLDRLATRGALAAAGGLTAVIKTAVDFETAFAGVEKTVEGTDAELAELEASFREMARTIPLSFEELAGIGEQAGALGIATADIEEFTRIAALIGTTTDVSSEQAATSLGQLSNVLKLTSEDYDNFGATLVDLGNKGASTESQILEIATRAGAGANLIGIASDQTLGWSSAVANLGIEVEAGGTAIQKFFLESLRNLQDDDTLEVMAETAGTTGKAFKQAFEEDASAALVTFLEGLGDLQQAEQLAVLDALGFSDQRITRALLGLAGNTDNLTDSLNVAGEAWQENSALSEEAEKRFRTTASQLTVLKNNVRDAGATIGEQLLPVVNELTQELVGWLQDPSTQQGIKDFASGLAEGIRGIVAELKGTDFSGLIGGLKLAAEVAKGAFNAFNALPGPVKQLAIAALVANKVSGGAVGQIAKGLGNIGAGLLGSGAKGGVAGLLGGRGSTPANPLFVSVVGPGGLAGGAGAAAGGGGLAGKLLKGGLAVAGGAIIGAHVGSFINEEVLGVKQAREFETGQVNAVLDSKDAGRIEHAIQVIESQLNPDDFGASVALALDVNGVRTTLEGQRDALEQQLSAMGVSRDQAAEQLERMTALKDGIGVAKDAQVGELRAMKGEISGDLTTLKATTDAASQHSTMKLSEVRAETAALHGTLRAKDFSPSFTNNTNVSVNLQAQISAYGIQRALQVATSAQQTTFSGRGGDSRF